MYKNQLQELAQRSCFNLPSYSCIREGPDHAPRFKATVNFNGEVFESPGYHTTLRHAEHAAAEVALNTLSRRGPTQSLAARILDETGVCKNLLQETAQRAGVSLPVYTTIRSGPKHVPLFKCMVEVGSRNFIGEPAKTKKQAEKNAAMAAWSSLKQLTPASHMPLLLESPEVDGVGDRINGGSYYSRDERATLQNSPSQMQFAAQTRVRMVNVRDRNRLSRDVNATGGQFYSGAPSTAVADAASSDRNCSRYIYNHQPVASPGEVSYEAGQRYLYNQSSISGSSHLPPDVSFDTLGHGHGGRVFYNPKATPSSFGSSSSRQQAGRHQRRHSLSGIESPMLSREAMAVSRASGGGNMLGRVMLHQQQQQIRGLPYQSLSERFDLNRPSLLEELQQRDEEDEWLRGEAMSSSARPQQLSIHCFPLQSQSERFEFKNHLLPQLEEVHCRDEEEWLHGESLGSINSLDREKSFDRKHGYREGWLRGETLMQSLEEQKNHGYREGWLRGEILKHSLEEEKRHGYREGWLCNEALKHNLEENNSLSQNHIHNHNHIHSHSHGYKDGWLHRETPGNNTEKERSHSHGHAYLKDVQGGKKTVYAAAAADSSSSSASPPSSPSSSLWSRSTQWWGSRMPARTSSAAAALASTLGLRPASSMAPAVRVRQMVPVCSAAPPRRTDAQAPSRPPLNDPSSSMVDGETGAHQLFNKLRL